MLKRLGMSTVAVVVAFMMAIAPQSAFADETRYFYFETEDGKWDGNIRVPNHGTVGIGFYQLKPSWIAPSSLKVRLCRYAGGWRCTSYKSPASGGNYVRFTNMYGDHYYIDVRDSWSGGSVSGMLAVTAWKP
ncbi:hypothetical protein [Desmospora profundinema]|uniref:Uncharacterized protein n=1 Tax=Desmospora profundinema TaxID=1571184 RepID=A0ABU1IPF7_9BACL|nr:hypothetical protein [Desmospora profundinema]MDR6226677.1 hypothetical protein [Desmospora profundinema]